MFISEVFPAIQGEGRFAGEPSAFVRTSGCNLRCWFCDTPYTSWHPEGDERSVESIVEDVRRMECRHVVVTGGEPLLFREVIELTSQLRARDHFVTIETAGSVYLPASADLMSISPKLSNSTPRGTDWELRHDERRHRPDVMRQLMSEYDYQLKFVIDMPGDVGEVVAYLREFPEVERDRVYLMPQAIDERVLREKSGWIGVEAAHHGWRLSPRLHIEQGGVATRGA